MKDFTISIVTPNYNYGMFLGELIDSVLSQDHKDFEHIIVDDGSTDGSVDMLEEYCRKDSRIKLLKQSHVGQTSAINSGLGIARGDVICWINSDDYYEKNVFSKIADYFRTHSQAMVVFGDFNIVDGEGRLIRIQKNIPLDNASGRFLGFGFCVTSNTVFWRRQVTETIGLLDARWSYNMDGEYFSRMAEAFRFEKIDVVVANYRKHSRTKTTDRSKAVERMREYELERRMNYEKTWQSRYIGYAIGRNFKYMYRLKRIFLRLLHGHYKEHLLQLVSGRR